jgi:integrase
VQAKMSLKVSLMAKKKKCRKNLTVPLVVKALKWKEGDPAQFEVKDIAHPGFYIRISKGGTKQWQYRFTFKGRVRRQTLGYYPATSCKKAFTDYQDAREKLKSGIDPLAERDAEKEAARRESERHALTLSVLFHDHFWPRYAMSKRTARNDAHYFRVKIEPVLGELPADSITPDAIERKGYSTGRLTLAVLRKMYNWAVMPESAEVAGEGAVLDSSVANPCRLYRLSDKNKPEPIVRHLKNDEIKQLWCSLAESNSARILKLQLLTGCRVSEVSGMVEHELDRDAGEWIIPSTRTKNKRNHLVPLTKSMLKLIGPPCNDFIFPAQSKEGHTTYSGPQQNMDRMCAKLGIENVSTHTLRRTFVTNMARLDVPLEIRDRLTNHTNQAIDGRYNMGYGRSGV